VYCCGQVRGVNVNLLNLSKAGVAYDAIRFKRGTAPSTQKNRIRGNNSGRGVNKVTRKWQRETRGESTKNCLLKRNFNQYLFPAENRRGDEATRKKNPEKRGSKKKVSMIEKSRGYTCFNAKEKGTPGGGKGGGAFPTA